jgi:hypothetical protein
MAYTILKSDGTILATIPDGQIDTTSTSVSLFGRNYAGYGQYIDTNFTHMLENFADNVPPSNRVNYGSIQTLIHYEYAQQTGQLSQMIGTH